MGMRWLMSSHWHAIGPSDNGEESSGSIVMDRAQKRDSKPGHRQVQRRHDDQVMALTDALGNLVDFNLLPGQRFDTVGVAPLIKGVTFAGLIAELAAGRQRFEPR